MKQMFSAIGWAALLALLVGTAGCARFIPQPTSGRALTEQFLLSAAIDENIDLVTQDDLSAMAGKKAYVRVGDLDQEELTADYIRAAFEQRLSALNVIPVETAEEADTLVIVRARVAGTDRNQRLEHMGHALFGILYHVTRQIAGAEIEAVAVSRADGATLWRSRPVGMTEKTFTELNFLFGLIGPFRGSSVERATN